MGYTLNTSSPDFKQTSSGAAITSTSVNINTGQIKAGGSDGTKLKAMDIAQTNQELYGSQLIVGPNATGFGDASGAVMTPGTGYVFGINVFDHEPLPKINATKTVRVVKTATAVRAGYWDIFNGVWTSAPGTADNFAALTATGIGTDAEIQSASNGRGLKGQFTYAMPSGSVNDDYDPYTN